LRIGISGTFDVENYGDLLFPLIAEAELSRRLGPIELVRFSYAEKSPPGWPYRVTPLTELPAMAGGLDGMLIGGGHVIRFDKDIAAGYAPPSAALHHPTGYWLTPALIAAQQGCPVVWNAPGVFGETPVWAEGLLRLALDASQRVAVRDPQAKQALMRVAEGADISVVPDTCFGVARLLPARPSAEFGRLRETLGLTQPYLVVQAVANMEPFCRMVREHPKQFGQYRIVALPVGPVHGDNGAILYAALPEILQLPNWPHPLVIAELIRHAAGVVGSSLHLAITALACGVPAFRPAADFGCKYEVLTDFAHVYAFGAEIDADWFTVRLGAAPPDTAVMAANRQLDQHWDAVAAIFRAGRPASREVIGRFWQSLPAWLEAECTRHARDAALGARDAALSARDSALDARDSVVTARDRTISVLHDQLAARDAEVALSRAEAAARHQDIAALYDSTSWKISAPVRWIGRRMRRQGADASSRVLDLDRIARHRLSTVPFDWAFVNDLYDPRDARALVASYPHDKFKTGKGDDGEKGYEYEARALIHLGANEIASADGLSDVWRRLAVDLLSADYRAAMSRLTGIDLSAAPMEAYVCHFGPGAWLGPHLDLKDKILTHVLYFNREWDPRDGGCLNILGSRDMADVVDEIPPLVGNSSVLVRSKKSWHSVTRVVEGCLRSRRSMNVIFYRPGAASTMWPAGDATPLHDYAVPEDGASPGLWRQMRQRLAL
jgi:hypothetical protein